MNLRETTTKNIAILSVLAVASSVSSGCGTRVDVVKVGVPLRACALAIQDEMEAAKGAGQCPAIRAPDGEELLSWRVAVLPYLRDDECAKLYREFHLDERWDSPHNVKLLDRMPSVYRVSGVASKSKSETHVQVLASSQPEGIVAACVKGQDFRFASCTDGTNETLLIVVATEPVPWTKPQDVDYDPAKPLPRLGIPEWNVIPTAVMAGSIVFIPKDTPEETLRGAISRNGDERIDLFALNQKGVDVASGK